jgi:hypothetical protein
MRWSSPGSSVIGASGASITSEWLRFRGPIAAAGRGREGRVLEEDVVQ